VAAARGNRKRAFWVAMTALALIVGGTLSSFFVRDQMAARITEREATEVSAAREGKAPPPGTSVALLRKEIEVVPYLLHLFTFGGCVVGLFALGELRGWRLFEVAGGQPPPPKIP
jgi:hypothetical protein